MFQSFLKQHDAAAWQRTLDALLPDIHEVDRERNADLVSLLPARAGAGHRGDR